MSTANDLWKAARAGVNEWAKDDSPDVGDMAKGLAGMIAVLAAAAVVLAAVGGAGWALISAVRWAWNHPLF